MTGGPGGSAPNWRTCRTARASGPPSNKTSAFAREVRDQARREAEHARRVGDEPARQEAIARFREAAQEIRQIQPEIANRPGSGP
jgi:hypothetical protein